MYMDPQNLKLNDLLHGRLFRIPPYQRPYSWQTEHRRDLFDDLRTLYQKRQAQFEQLMMDKFGIHPTYDE